jgi:small ligand-binding sensory domain FIST
LPAPVEIQGEYGKYIIRYMSGKDDQAGSVTIQSEIPAGTDIRIVRRDKELIRNGLKDISTNLRETLGDRKAKFVLQFECVGRGKVVFREQEKIEMIRSLQEDIGSDIPWLGFYSYGEIGPIKQVNCFHNFTSVIIVVY